MNAADSLILSDFLQSLVDNNQEVFIYLQRGTCLTGQIRRFDHLSLFLTSSVDDEEQIVMLSSISTILYHQNHHGTPKHLLAS